MSKFLFPLKLRIEKFFRKLFGNSTRDRWIIFLSFIGFLVLIILIHLFYRKPLARSLDNYFGNGFYLSLVSAFLENFVFFGFIGLIAQFISMRSPEDHPFERRIEALANSFRFNNYSKNYLLHETKKLLAYNKEAIVTIVLEELNENLGVVKTSGKWDTLIVNMCKDVKFSLSSSKYILEPDVFIQGIGGQINHLSLTDNQDKKKKIQVISESKPEIITEGSGRIEGTLDSLEIEADGSATFKYDFWLWGKYFTDEKVDKNWFNAYVTRFTTNFKIFVENRTNKTVNIKYKYTQRNPITFELSQNAQKIYETKIEPFRLNKFQKPTELMSEIIFLPNDHFDIYIGNFV